MIGRCCCYTYIELKKGTDSKIVDEKIKEFYKRTYKRIEFGDFPSKHQKDSFVFFRKICIQILRAMVILPMSGF